MTQYQLEESKNTRWKELTGKPRDLSKMLQYIIRLARIQALMRLTRRVMK